MKAQHRARVPKPEDREAWERLARIANGVTRIEIPTLAKRKDMALLRLMLDFEALQDVTGAKDDEPWFSWAESHAIELRNYLMRKGYAL